jgi:hypothetical protein
MININWKGITIVEIVLESGQDQRKNKTKFYVYQTHEISKTDVIIFCVALSEKKQYIGAALSAGLSVTKT